MTSNLQSKGHIVVIKYRINQTFNLVYAASLFPEMSSLRERLRTHEIFIEDKKKSYFCHNYQKFSIKSYVVIIC